MMLDDVVDTMIAAGFGCGLAYGFLKLWAPPVDWNRSPPWPVAALGAAAVGRNRLCWLKAGCTIVAVGAGDCCVNP